MMNPSINNAPHRPAARASRRCISRDRLLALLSAEEARHVTRAEAEARVASGEHYLDLYRLDRGVLTASGSAGFVGNVLPKRAVRGDLWCRILSYAPDLA